MIMCAGILVGGHEARSQMYTADDYPNESSTSRSISAEGFRWLVNRARFDPAGENFRQGTNYSVPVPTGPISKIEVMTTAANFHLYDLYANGVVQTNTLENSSYYNYLIHPTSIDRARKEGYQAQAVHEVLVGGIIWNGKIDQARDAFQNLWNNADARAQLLSSNWREMGIGDLRGYPTIVIDLGRSVDSFFTDTIFYDRNGNGFDSGEGEMGVKIFLRTPTGIDLPQWDLSNRNGGVAIPFSADQPAGSELEVWAKVYNTQSNYTEIFDIPIGNNLFSRVTISGYQEKHLGNFIYTPGRNYGFRNLQPPQFFLPVPNVRAFGPYTNVNWRTQSGYRYDLETSDDSVVWDAQPVFSEVSTEHGKNMIYTDAFRRTRRFYRLRVTKVTS